MPTICCVPNCKTYGGHLFPKDPVIKEKWERAIGRPSTKLSKVCRNHFKEEDYVGESVGSGPSKVRQRLKKDAIPSVFPWNCKKWKSLRDFKNDNNNFVVKESKTNIAVKKQAPEAKSVPKLPVPSTETLAFSCVEAIYDSSDDVNDSDSNYDRNDDSMDDDTDDEDTVETMIPIHPASYSFSTSLQNSIRRLKTGTVPSVFSWNNNLSSPSIKDSMNNDDQWYNDVCIRRNGISKSNIVNGESKSTSIKSKDDGLIGSIKSEESWINGVCIKRKSKAQSSSDTNDSTDSMTKMDPQSFALSCVEAIYNEDNESADEKEEFPHMIATNINIKHELETEANNCITEIVDSYRCALCFYCTENKEEFRKHMDKHKNTNIITESDTNVRNRDNIRCAHCNYIAKTAMALKNHCKMHINSKFRCSSCSFAGISLQDLITHHKSEHVPHQTVKKYRKPNNNLKGKG